MYENSKRYAAGREAAAYLATGGRTVQSAATRAGVKAGVVAIVVQLAAMRASGAQVSAADMAKAGLLSQRYTDEYLAEAKRQKWVRSDGGKLSVCSAGRQVVADVARAWERSVRQLTAFSSAIPFKKRAAKPQDDQA